MKTRLTKITLALLFLVSITLPDRNLVRANDKPNIVIVFTDDQGYADIGCYGAKGFQTPNIDRLAMEGRRFTNFYAGATICSPSRAALLTGCYPHRVGIGDYVFFPTRKNDKGEKPGPGTQGLNPNEITVAEILKEQGYATACVGKWHLGDAKPFLPTRQGFDEYFGLPYSNDMRNGANPPGKWIAVDFPPLPLYDGEEIIETDPDQRFLTRRYTERAVDFIKRNKEKPFFLYLPHSMPHIPLYAHPDFEGKSEQGLYGDVIQEIDWSIGQIAKTLKECGIDEKTLVIYTSDNGPWLTMGDHGGKATPLRDGKQTKYDGGHRVFCLMRYPEKIKAGSIGEAIISSIDLMPTIAKLCGGKVPEDRVIDGVEAWDYFSGSTETSPRTTYFYDRRVVRHEQWKLFTPGKYREFHPDKMSNLSVEYKNVRLYDLDADIAETTDVSEKHPETVAALQKLLDDYRTDLRENSRPVGHIKNFHDDEPGNH